MTRAVLQVSLMFRVHVRYFHYIFHDLGYPGWGRLDSVMR